MTSEDDGEKPGPALQMSIQTHGLFSRRTLVKNQQPSKQLAVGEILISSSTRRMTLTAGNGHS